MNHSENLPGLVAAATKGDGCALDQLFLREYESLLAFVRSKMPAGVERRASAEDLLHETLLRATRGITTFNGDNPAAFRAWLHKIARNTIADDRKANRARIRDERREAHLEWTDDSLVGLLNLLPADVRTPSQSASGREIAAAVRSAMDQIPDDYRNAIHLRYLQGLRHREIAERMGRTEHAVHMLCNHGLKALAKVLGSSSMFFSSTA